MAWIPCVVTVRSDAADAVDLALADFVLVNDQADIAWGPTSAAARLLPADLQFQDGALAPGECRTGLLAFLLPDDTAPPLMLEWQSPRYGTLAGIFPTIVVTRFIDGDPTALAQEITVPDQNPACR
ncbi:MAG TPA: hypothetical protein VFQ80_12250 [Thermomicrobiales bacterium]|nr:hypothetical protein [Thermomicrobiales bacterium]